MGIAEDLDKEANKSNLRVDAILNSLEENDRAKTLEALRGDEISATRIATILTDNGYTCGKDAVLKWRRAQPPVGKSDPLD